MKTHIFDKMKYDLKGHKCHIKPPLYMPKSFQHISLWTDFIENLYEC